MKMKKIILLLLVMSMVFALCACGTQSTQPDDIQSPSSENGDRPYRSPGLKIIDGWREVQSDGTPWYYFTVKNNTKVTIERIFIEMVLVDENNKIIDTITGGETARVAPNQSIDISHYDWDKNPAKKVYVDSYTIRIDGEDYEEFVEDSPIISIP